MTPSPSDAHESLGFRLGFAWASLVLHLGLTCVSLGRHLGFTWASLGLRLGFEPLELQISNVRHGDIIFP